MWEAQKHYLSTRKGKEVSRRAVKKYFGKLRAQMFEAYGHSCSCCNETIKEFLTLEHLNGTGKEHRISAGKGWGALLDLRKKGWPKEGYTVLCMNCNFAKRFGKICPHKVTAQTPIQPLLLPE